MMHFFPLLKFIVSLVDLWMREREKKLLNENICYFSCINIQFGMEINLEVIDENSTRAIIVG